MGEHSTVDERLHTSIEKLEAAGRDAQDRLNELETRLADAQSQIDEASHNAQDALAKVGAIAG